MKLLKLTATFGCLQGETLTFGSGMTLIGAANGSGKSTWCAFLRAMLYGLDTRQRDKRGAPADKNRYRPWNGAPMEGSMLCEYSGSVIEVRRTSQGGVPMGDFSAVYVDSGRPVPGLTGENLGETLTGVGREVFDRSVFLRQSSLAVTQSQELERRISALVSTGEEEGSWSEADEALKSWQHRRRFHNAGLLPQLEQEEQEINETLRQTNGLRQDLDQAQSRADALRQEQARWDALWKEELDQRKASSRQRYDQASTELDAAEHRVRTLQSQYQAEADVEGQREMEEDVEDLQYALRLRRRHHLVFVLLSFLITLAAAAWYIVVNPMYLEPLLPDYPLTWPQPPLIPLAAAVGALWLLVLLTGLFKLRKDRRDRQELDELQDLLEEERNHAQQHQELQDALAQREQARKYFEAVESTQSQEAPTRSPEAESCREALHTEERAISQLEGRLSALGDPVLLEARLDNLQEERSRLETDFEAISLAREVLSQADEQLHARFSPQLSQQAALYFSKLTQGKYDQINLDRSLNVTVRETGSFSDRPLAYLSRGTADQLYLSLRLAVAQLLLPPGQPTPLVLDDALLTFDDHHLAITMELLTELSKQRQVILFTCQHREFALLENARDLTTLKLPGF
ncbi:MAG: AAA family ATPase [Ruminiclostridium sp.]|nr:AAA family ATPase [Ruminiclostridium sp.]